MRARKRSPVAEQVLVVDEQAVGRGVASREIGYKSTRTVRSACGPAVLAPSSGEEPDRHAIEQVSRRWREGRRDDSARPRRKILSPHRPRRARDSAVLARELVLRSAPARSFTRRARTSCAAASVAGWRLRTSPPTARLRGARSASPPCSFTAEEEAIVPWPALARRGRCLVVARFVIHLKPTALGATSRGGTVARIVSRSLASRADQSPVSVRPSLKIAVDAAEVGVASSASTRAWTRGGCSERSDEALARFWYQGDVGRGRREGGRNCHREAPATRALRIGAIGGRRAASLPLVGGHLCVPGWPPLLSSLPALLVLALVLVPSRALCASAGLLGLRGSGAEPGAHGGGIRAALACSLGTSLCSA